MYETPSRPSLEEIMTRLKGSAKICSREKNYSFSDTQEDTAELKQVISVLGNKLKTIMSENEYREKQFVSEKELYMKQLADLQTELHQSTSEKTALQDHFQKQNGEIIFLKKQLEKTDSSGLKAALLDAQEKILHYEKRVSDAEESSQSATLELEKKIAQSMQALDTLQNSYETVLKEKETLENDLRMLFEKQKTGAIDTSANILHLAATCRKLEDEIHSLTCEKSATTKQIRSLKEQLSTLLENETLLKDHIHEIETQYSLSKNLLQEKESSLLILTEKLEKVEKSHQGSSSQLESLILLQKETEEKYLSLKKTHEQIFQELHEKNIELEKRKEEIDSLNTLILQMQEENSKTTQRAEESEQVLAAKISLITELHEQIEFMKTLASNMNAHNELLLREKQDISFSLKTMEESFSALSKTHEEMRHLLEQKEEECHGLKEQLQKYEVFEKIVQEARSVVSSLTKTLHAPNSPVTVEKLVEELHLRPKDSLGIYVGDQFEQNDLF